MSLDGFKIFLSNIPYDCTTEKLKDVMKQYEGFIDVKIYTDNNDKSRGNGIAIFDTKDNGFKLLEINDLEINGRNLRFYKYINNNVNNKRNNTIFLKDIPNDTDVDDLREKMENKYGSINKCVIYKNKADKMCGLIEIKEYNKFKEALDDGIIDLNGNECVMREYVTGNKKSFNVNKNDYINKNTRRSIYLAGFNAGRKFGFNECILLKKSENITEDP
jgi:RNA recognition motif-containing protein